MIALSFQRPADWATISFMSGSKPVMKLSKDGITVDPDVKVIDAANAVIEVLDAYIKNLVSDKDAEIARLRAELAKQETE